MKHVAKAQAQKFANSPTCTVYEYAMDDPDINGAVGVINGRYPETGMVVNEVCKEIVYVISGEGSLTTGKTTQPLAEGDVALIAPGEQYFFEGKDLKIFMPCTPAWYPEQHKELNFKTD
ncbi:MAG TPA: AraC family ligand binding domain-containing protein [Candidatus Saccharimonadales bacterium]|nr:AraC family ligand binding domain-containing protein [Candidatus Saccharimonadales bacterium]